jgi:CubicO group peptidase (beta-lactamase class C family)
MIAACLAQRQPKQGQDQRGGGSDREIQTEADRIVQQMMKQNGIPAVVLAVVKNGKVVVEKGYGTKSTDSKQPPDENTVFYIGSLSKAITAVGAMLLVDKGKLKLDDPASRYMKDLPHKWDGITVRQFMTHTSGLPELPKRHNRRSFQAGCRIADGLQTGNG